MQKCLILDDSRTDAYLAEKVAKEFFDDVTVCGTHSGFRTALANGMPDLIFMDIHLGDLRDGITIVDECRKDDSDVSIVPIVVVTASSDSSLHEKAINCGASAVITKPLSAEKVRPLLPKLIPFFQFKNAG